MIAFAEDPTSAPSPKRPSCSSSTRWCWPRALVDNAPRWRLGRRRRSVGLLGGPDPPTRGKPFADRRRGAAGVLPPAAAGRSQRRRDGDGSGFDEGAVLSGVVTRPCSRRRASRWRRTTFERPAPRHRLGWRPGLLEPKYSTLAPSRRRCGRRGGAVSSQCTKNVSVRRCDRRRGYWKERHLRAAGTRRGAASGRRQRKDETRWRVGVAGVVRVEAVA